MSALSSVQPKTGADESQETQQALAIERSFQVPSQPKAVIAIEQSNGVIAASSSSVQPQLSQLEAQASAIERSFQVPSQPKAVIAIEQSNGVIAASSSVQSLITAIESDII